MSKHNDLLASAKRHAIASTQATSEKTREAERKTADRRWKEAEKVSKK